MPNKDDTYLHYCEGTWVDGFVLDCALVDEHRVKLQQTKDQYDKALFRLGSSGRTG